MDLTKAKKLHHVRLSTGDLDKLKKHRSLKVDKYLIHVDDLEVPQVKMYGVL